MQDRHVTLLLRGGVARQERPWWARGERAKRNKTSFFSFFESSREMNYFQSSTGFFSLSRLSSLFFSLARRSVASLLHFFSLFAGPSLALCCVSLFLARSLARFCPKRKRPRAMLYFDGKVAAAGVPIVICSPPPSLSLLRLV